jgi:hypothetical protein
VRRGADEYALDMLDRLDGELHRVQTAVRNAVDALSNQPRTPATEEQP